MIGYWIGDRLECVECVIFVNLIVKRGLSIVDIGNIPNYFNLCVFFILLLCNFILRVCLCLCSVGM